MAEYSTQTPQTTPVTRYLTSDHLGSPRIITGSNGAVLSRRDFMPYGEEAFIGVGNRAVGHGYTYGDSTRQKFTGYERDEETNLDFAQARMYSYTHGRFTSVDPLMASSDVTNPQTFNRYVYVGNNPTNITDPTGLIGDYYDKSGNWLFNDDIDDDLVYVQEEKERKDENGNSYINLEYTKLGITHTQFQREASTVCGESSFFKNSVSLYDLLGEMMAIVAVYQRNRRAFGVKSVAARDFRNDNYRTRYGKKQAAVAAVIHVLTGGVDYSNGADGWDGIEQARYPASDDRLRDNRRRFEIRMNTGGWEISKIHYNIWKTNARKAGLPFRAPRRKAATGGINKGKIRYRSTAVYGLTIFWRIN